MTQRLSDDALGLIFNDARTHSSWRAEPVSQADLHAIYDLAKMGPTSANGQPMRIAFVMSAEAKEKLRPALALGNVDKTMSAPVVAILAHDLDFYEYYPETFPIRDMRSMYVGKPKMIEEAAFRNGTLQSAYFIIAARALGFDCGPMSGFDNAMVDEVFFDGTKIKSNFLCNIGHGDGKSLFPRLPRLDFDRVCTIL